MQNLLARLIHAREEDEKEKEKDKDVDDLEDDDLDEDDDEDFDDDDDDWDDDDDEEEGEEEAGAERRRASRRGPGRAADAARVFLRMARSARALDGPPGSITSSGERYAPATVMRAILSVGAAIALRARRSLPTISMSRSMSRRFPAMVSSSTGWASSPFSIHSPAAPRE